MECGAKISHKPQGSNAQYPYVDPKSRAFVSQIQGHWGDSQVISLLLPNRIELPRESCFDTGG